MSVFKDKDVKSFDIGTFIEQLRSIPLKNIVMFGAVTFLLALKQIIPISAISDIVALINSAKHFLDIRDGENIDKVANKILESLRKSKELQNIFRQIAITLLINAENRLVLEEIQNKLREFYANTDTMMEIVLKTAMQIESLKEDVITQLKTYAETIDMKLVEIKEFVSYYRIPSSIEEVKDDLNLPSYIDNVIVLDDYRKGIINDAIDKLLSGKNVAIIGEAGLGKTVMLYLIWKELNKIVDVGIIEDAENIKNFHVKLGLFLIYDNLNSYRILYNILQRKKISNIIITIRDYEWEKLPKKAKDQFYPIYLRRFSDDKIKDMARVYFKRSNIEFNEEAINELAKKAKGSPIFVRIAYDLVCNKGLNIFTKDLISDLGDEIIEYIAEIVEDIVMDPRKNLKDGAYGALLSMMCLAEIPDYETHEFHFEALYDYAAREAREVFGETINRNTFISLKKILERNKALRSVRFKHDYYADLFREVKTEKHIGNVLITIKRVIPFKKRIEIIKNSLISEYERIKNTRMSEKEKVLATYIHFMNRIMRYITTVIPSTLQETMSFEENIEREIVQIASEIKHPILRKIPIITSREKLEEREKEILQDIINRAKNALTRGNMKEIDSILKELENLNTPKAIFNQGVIYYKLGEYSRALDKFYEAYRRGDPELRRKAYWNIVVTLIKMGKFDEARKRIDEITETNLSIEKLKDRLIL